MYDQVIGFWFDQASKAHWFAASEAFDQQVRERFLSLTQQAAQAELYSWRSSAKGRLAEIILLDQFSRTIWRGTSKAFSQDPLALALCQEAISQGALETLNTDERQFLLMPIMHSESQAIHAWGEPLFKAHTTPEVYEFELKHKAIIDRFGRYPHRNRALGRVSSQAEQAFLLEPDSSF